jgi:uncharacterized BrkB/YihY/UPF0761 family membrane protein
MEQNPYEAPKEGEPLKPVQVAKRGLGFVAILLLTPLAVAIAFGVSCTAASKFVDATLPCFQGNASTFTSWAWFISTLALFLVPPVATFAGMIWWAARALRRKPP